jgi:surface protein
MHIRKYLSIFLVGLVFAIAGCSGGSSSSGGSSDADLLPDTDGDGIVDQHDFDIDGDGIDNNIDDDIDGDGTLNKDDSTANGPVDEHEELDLQLPYPNLFCTSAQIIPPHHERLTGATVIVKWELLPKKCGWDQNGQTGRASAASNAIQGYNPLATYSRPVSPGLLKASLVIPHHCALVGDRKEYPIRYSIKEIQKAVAGETDYSAYQQTVHHYIGNGKTFCASNSLPDTPKPGDEPVTNGTFASAIKLWFTDEDAAFAKYGHISNWNVSDVKVMDYAFIKSGTANSLGATASFNEDISQWDVSGVTDMYEMFYTSSFNRDISNWDVSSVTDMRRMFTSASSFNQDLSGWCVSGITSEPNEFDLAAGNWTKPRPNWGECPLTDSN